MASGSGGAGGRKRKASPEAVAAPARREPRRGMGVAELERIRVTIEMAERCYAALLAGDVARAGNGAVHHHRQLQMPRAYLAPYRLPQHYLTDDSLTRQATAVLRSSQLVQ
ncbi:hypothetical protein BS78_01G339600 [Paspalum vaginatum]|nr:hypothetical protein BS78_01G339600 [Paspalum vaginatum]